MAGEATHIILADRILADRGTQYNRRDFIVGTVFPDIRYLGDLDRDVTHLREISMEHVLSETDSFIAGAKFHSLVDKVRNDFIKTAGMYDLCPPFLYDQQSLKFLEDELFYPEYGLWADALKYFEQVREVPVAYPVSEEIVAQWYAIIRGYVAVPPNEVSRLHLLVAEGYTREAVILINAYIEELRKNKAVTDLMKDFYTQFPTLI